MAQPLRDLDAALWYLDTPSQPLVVSAVLKIGDYPYPKVGFGGFVELLASRLDRLSFLRNVVVPSPIVIGGPRWARDPGFDIRRHVKLRSLEPTPAGDDGELLHELIREILNQPLNRKRPPWEITYIESPLGADYLVAKVHHALLDGGLGIESLAALLDLGPVEPRSGGVIDSGEVVDEESPTAGVGIMEALGSLPFEVFGRMRNASTLVESLGSLMEGTGIGDPSALNALLNFGAPRYSTTGALTSRRDFHLWRVPLSQLRTIAQRAKMTINEVVLAATGFAHAYHLRESGDPKYSVAPIAMVPISTRAQRGEEPGNKVSAQLVELPIDLEDPLGQLRRAHQASRTAKDFHGLLGPEVMEALAGIAPSQAMAPFARFLESGKIFDRLDPPFNLVVSNLSGSPVELFLGGNALEVLYPLGPLAQGAPINLTMASYVDVMAMGLMFCPDLFQDPKTFQAGFTEALERFEASLGSDPDSI